MDIPRNYTYELLEALGRYFPAKLLVSGFATTFAYLFGSENLGIMTGLLALLLIDFCTGIMAAYVTGNPITSRRAFKSAFKTTAYGLLAASAHITETIIPGSTMLDELVIAFLAVTELISILENTGKMGYAIPKKMLYRLEEFRNDQ